MIDDGDLQAGERCALCERGVPRLTAHHLVPRMRHRQKRTRRRFSAEERQATVMLCPPCHRNIHAHIDEKTLAEQYFTLERLRRHEAVEKFTAWVRWRPPGKRIAMPRRRGARR
jgi:hypothetical protein